MSPWLEEHVAPSCLHARCRWQAPLKPDETEICWLRAGHYVAHLKRQGRWVIYNDEKVAESAAPPRDLGYMYLFKRADVA